MGTAFEEPCEVLVIGAGPTGLMAACLLSRAGVRVRILDRNTGPSKESRAGVMTARSLELFASLGLDDKLFDRGIITTELDFYVSGARAGGLRYDKAGSPDAPFQFILMIPQSATEAVLIDALTTAGLAVERGVEVTGFTQDETGVRIDVLRNGTDFSLAADYVIGADGARSIVRSQLKLGFDGEKYPQDFLLGDVEVDWALDQARFRVFMHGERIGLFLPLYGNRARVMTTDMSAPAGAERSLDAERLELGELESAFSKVACLPVKLGNPDWLTRFRTHHRMVDRYSVGRVFVAGDAAHIHSPAGGQGMNTGLQDAANLAWKLTAVLRHGASAALLATYEKERMPVAREVLNFTNRLFGMAAGQTGWRAKLRDMLAPAIVGPMTELDAIQNKAFRKLGQIDVAYGKSLVVSRADGEGKTPGPGERAPDARISRRRDLFDLIAGYRFTVLALSRKRLTGAEVDSLQRDLAGLPECPFVMHRIVARLTVGRHEAVEPVETVDVFDRYGLCDDLAQALLVVRPDGYIGWRSEQFDFADCSAFLSSVTERPQGVNGVFTA